MKLYTVYVSGIKFGSYHNQSTAIHNAQYKSRDFIQTEIYVVEGVTPRFYARYYNDECVKYVG